MSEFTQIHLLTSYPPANLNRDDLGRPKTAEMGGAQRLRVSSQCLKRTWRMSDTFRESAELEDKFGVRTKTMGKEVYEDLVEAGVDEDDATDWAESIVKEFGKTERSKKDQPLRTLKHKQLVHFTPGEIAEINKLVDLLAEEEREPTDEELELVAEDHRAVDIGMFGRMLADTPKFNTEAAVQVAHALSVHEAAVEDDFFTAVDDLNDGSEDSGAAHMGQKEFGAGLFYLYICVDRKQLVENLQGDEELAGQAIGALLESAATVAPSGMQNSFGSRAYANYALVERGSQQPRSLSVAFLSPVEGENWLDSAIDALNTKRQNFEQVYGNCADAVQDMNAETGQGSLADLVEFVREPQIAQGG